VLSNVVHGLFLRSSLIYMPSRNPKLSQDVGILLELAIDVFFLCQLRTWWIFFCFIKKLKNNIKKNKEFSFEKHYLSKVIMNKVFFYFK
jgi:hypothetical protein